MCDTIGIETPRRDNSNLEKLQKIAKELGLKTTKMGDTRLMHFGYDNIKTILRRLRGDPAFPNGVLSQGVFNLEISILQETSPKKFEHILLSLEEVDCNISCTPCTLVISPKQKDLTEAELLRAINRRKQALENGAKKYKEAIDILEKISENGVKSSRCENVDR